jgi:hypothetical protein
VEVVVVMILLVAAVLVVYCQARQPLILEQFIP